MSDEIPQWAKERACELANAIHEYPRFTVDHLDRDWPSLQAFARYIAAHEEPPVDPVIDAIEDALAQFYKGPGQTWPGTMTMASAIIDEFTKRGIELASERQS
jgi:hypothetical protein